MKKYLSLLIIFISIILIASSCGKKKPLLRVALWDDLQRPFEEQLAEKFMKENSGIDVKVEMTPWDTYFTKAETAAQGGEMADILWMDLTSFGRFASSGIILPIDDMVSASGVDLSVYPAISVDAYRYNGKLYALPRDIDSICVFYNKMIFDKAGIPYPKDGWAWEDMVKTGKQIRAKVKDVHPLVFDLSAGQMCWYNIIGQNGGTILTSDKKKSGWSKPVALESIKMVKKLIDDGVLPSSEQLSDLQPLELFQSDKIAMYYDGSWSALPIFENEIVRDHVGVVEMPIIKQKETAAHSVGYLIAAKTRYPQEAFKLVRFLTNKESQEFFAKTGVVIPANIEAQKLWPQAFKNADVTAFIRALQYARMVPGTKETAAWYDIELNELKNVWSGKESPEIVVPRMAKLIDEAIAKE